MKQFTLGKVLGLLLIVNAGLFFAQKSLAEDSQNVDFIALAKSIVKNDAKENAERERVSKLALAEQKRLLRQTNQEIAEEEKEKQRLKALFDKNEDDIATLQEKLDLASGTLGEVFGVAKESALDLIPSLEDSMTSAQFPDRITALRFAETSKVPTLLELQALFSSFESEIVESGKIELLDLPVVALDGKTSPKQVLRIGTFSAMDERGNYLAWDLSKQQLSELPTQPSETFSQIPQLDTAIPTTLLIDPTRGELFALLDREPTLQERIAQGGNIGYIIIALGLIGLLIGLYQLLKLLKAELGVRKQLQSQDLRQDNPLGRVLHAVKSADVENDNDALELKVDEAVMAELANLEQGQSFLKLLAAVAPLLGLLGTVVGMIATFQSISVFGTSDPKLMASGISQALMTTVLGLVVAVPILFAHSVLTSRSCRIIQILQQKSFGALGSLNQIDSKAA
ncbi:hypothetical protein A3715_11545 [Oleiphilus sp. HI0009]|nr:hypothetical protein A3715_11545 [Oleiphilus sp. HI0009]